MDKAVGSFAVYGGVGDRVRKNIKNILGKDGEKIDEEKRNGKII